VAVKIRLDPVHTEVPEEDNTTLGLVTEKLRVLEDATVVVKQVPPLMLMLHLIVLPLDRVVLVYVLDAPL